jgi:hypothetical protein
MPVSPLGIPPKDFIANSEKRFPRSLLNLQRGGMLVFPSEKPPMPRVKKTVNES